MMKKRHICHFLWMCTAALLLAACTNDDSAQLPPTDGAGQGTINVSIAPQQIIGEEVPYDSRALNPLAPEYENTIYTLTTLVFDSEQLLVDFPATEPGSSAKHYMFHDLRDANGDGLLNTTLSTSSFPMDRLEGQSCTVCLIANMEEADIAEMLQKLADENNQAIFLSAFKNVEVAIPYYAPGGEGNFEQGHVSTIYMFGYYEGTVSKDMEIDVTLGRIISRLEMSFTIPDDVPLRDNSNMTIYSCMENLERNAHLFPIGVSPGAGAWTEEAGKPTDKYFGGSMGEMYVASSPRRFTIYFYSGPNSAQNEDQALQLQLWYRSTDLSAAEVNALYDTEPDATIYLCNDQPGVANRNFQLNRNSVYRFNLNLTRK